MPDKQDTLSDWLAYIETRHSKLMELGLERVAAVRRRLGLNPPFPVIVVGGTNGKGSVCAMLESMLHMAGYRVGCYTSPHLLNYNERVRIGLRQASDALLCAAFERVEQARVALPLQECPSREQASDEGTEISLTYFEFGTLAAMQCFMDQGIEVAILEVGLGGRLDAVNVFDHDCAVVTSIDLDHMEYLGDTREKIAFEKAGIFRAGKVAVFGDRDVPLAIRTQAQNIGAWLWCLGEQFDFTADEQQWNYQGGRACSALPYPALRGVVQLHNASTALAVLDALRDRLPVSMAAVRRGLVEVELPGRFQVMPGKPMMILDVAHNPQAARALARNLASLPPCRKTFAVFAMLKDKDMAKVACALNEQVDVWLVAGIAAPRGATATELSGELHAGGVKGAVRTFVTIIDALYHACNEVRENDRIIIFGSFYTVAEAIRAQPALRLICAEIHNGKTTHG